MDEVRIPLGRVMECACGAIVVVRSDGTRMDAHGRTHLHLVPLDAAQ
jgi:hypothetical protein